MIDDNQLKLLKAPFSPDRISVKVQSLNRDRNRALLVQYLQHTDVADRLDEVDPSWSSKIHKVELLSSGEESLVFVHMELTVCGVSRDNTGEGKDPKSATSDALKRCASAFGVGRYLYDEGKVWVPYSEANDRYREWTSADYEQGRAPASPPAPSRSQGSGKKSPVTPLGNSVPLPKTKPALLVEIRRCSNLLQVSEVDLRSWARESAGVPADKMEVPQLQKFIGELQLEMRKAGIPV